MKTDNQLDSLANKHSIVSTAESNSSESQVQLSDFERGLDFVQNFLPSRNIWLKTRNEGFDADRKLSRYTSS